MDFEITDFETFSEVMYILQECAIAIYYRESPNIHEIYQFGAKFARIMAKSANMYHADAESLKNLAILLAAFLSIEETREVCQKLRVSITAEKAHSMARTDMGYDE